ncbi:MAG TPA: FAD-dependent monooxygenase [Jiangellales bacterium]|nr:FAD-dependent monooxygenase [Jiangellales bacterium]
MSDPRRVLVVGAGIAGLATARALLGQGIQTDVVERSDSWRHPGAGVYLPANAVRALGALGLGSSFLDRACPITQQRFLDHRGRVLVEVDLHAVWGATGPCAAIEHRGLHELLREGIPVRRGTTVTALEEEGPRVHVVFDDGSSSDYDLVVGADGVRSCVRTVVFGGAPPRPLAQASWRFLADDIGQTSAWTVHLGRTTAFLMIPLGRGRIYCYADVTSPAAVDPTAGDPVTLGELYRDFAEPVPTIVDELLAAGNSPHFSAIQEVTQEPWVTGRVVLVGDAAHAMSPNMAQGVGMALEDALVLAQTVAAGRPLHDYEARRRSRVRFVQTQTHRRDRTRGLPTVVRDAALRIGGQRIFRSNYHALLGEP